MSRTRIATSGRGISDLARALIQGCAWVWMVLFLTLGIILPITALVSEVLRAQAPGSSIYQVMTDPLILTVVHQTLWQAAWSTAVSFALGLPLGVWVGGWVQSHPHSHLRKLLQALLVIPFGVPSLVAAMSWVTILSHTDWAYSFKALILSHVFLNTPLIALSISHARSLLPMDQYEAAATLGGGRLARFRSLTWPGVRMAAASAVAQVFSLCSMSFALVMILGGGPPVQTLETLLYSYLKFGYLNTTAAAACGLWAILISMTPWCLYLLFRASLGGYVVVRSSSTPQKQASGFSGILLVLLVSILVVPYCSIFVPEIFTNFADVERRTEMARAFWVSMRLAGISSVGAVLSALAALMALSGLKQRSRSRLIAEILVSVPSGASALVLGLGVWLAYGEWLDPFEGSLLAMGGLQCVLFFPLAYRILWPLGQSSSAQLEAAVSLGASWPKAFLCVEWPRWKAAVLSAFAAVIGGSLAEFGAASLFYSEKLIPVSVLIARWRTKYHFVEAQGLAGLLLAVSCVLFLIFSLSFKSGSFAESETFGVKPL